MPHGAEALKARVWLPHVRRTPVGKAGGQPSTACNSQVPGLRIKPWLLEVLGPPNCLMLPQNLAKPAADSLIGLLISIGETANWLWLREMSWSWFYLEFSFVIWILCFSYQYVLLLKSIFNINCRKLSCLVLECLKFRVEIPKLHQLYLYNLILNCTEFRKFFPLLINSTEWLATNPWLAGPQSLRVE